MYIKLVKLKIWTNKEIYVKKEEIITTTNWLNWSLKDCKNFLPSPQTKIESCEH